MSKTNLLLLPGDGVGPEIMDEAIKVISVINDAGLYDISYDSADIGGIAIDNHNTPYPDETSKKCLDADCILLGAVGTKKHENNKNELKPESGLLALRKSLELYINVRPIFIFDSLIDSSSLKPELLKGLDIVIIRELIGDVYFGEPRGFKNESSDKTGYNTMSYSTSEVERIADYAFNVATKRASKVVSVDKANVLEASQVWRETVDKIQSNKYSNVDLSHMYVDNAAMQLVQNPKQFDVIVTENLFGDILSDIASVLTGSIGMLPSASLNEKNFGVYEPIHGSAPDIAGKDIVNPIAAILSVAMMFQHTFDRVDIYNSILNAVKSTLQNKKFTKDIANNKDYISTESMGDYIVEKIKGESND